MRAERVGDDTALAQIVDLVERAQGSKAPIQRIADRVTGWFVPAVIGVAALTFVGWLVLGPEPKLTYALTSAIAVLIIACPCAMGLATPTAIMVGTGKGAENGILIRDGAALEDAHRITTVVLDKTGTITRGIPSVASVQPVDGIDGRELLRLVAAVERGSEHPLGEAIVRHADEAGVDRTEASGFEATAGQGVRAAVDGATILAGTEGYLRSSGIDPSALLDAAAVAAADGASPVLVARDGRPIGLIAVADAVKPSSADAIRRLQRAGIEVWMISGDRRATAVAIGAQVGIGPDRILAEVLPAEKAAARGAAAGRGRARRHGRRRHQRCPRARAGRRRDLDRYRGRRRPRGFRHHAHRRRSRRGADRDAPVARHDAGHSSEPGVGLRLQHPPHPGGRRPPLPAGRPPAVPRPRGRRHGALERQRGRQLPPPPGLPERHHHMENR